MGMLPPLCGTSYHLATHHERRARLLGADFDKAPRRKALAIKGKRCSRLTTTRVSAGNADNLFWKSPTVVALASLPLLLSSALLSAIQSLLVESWDTIGSCNAVFAFFFDR
jgi:hypothetical protein